MNPIIIPESNFPEVTLKVVSGKDYMGKTQITNSTDAIQYICNLLHDCTVENLIMISLGHNCRPINYSLLAKGTIEKASFSMTELVRTMLLSNAYGCILLHNHNNNAKQYDYKKPIPSEQDLKITYQIQKAFSLFGLTLVDMIIVGPDKSYFSCLGEHVGVFSKTTKNMKNSKTKNSCKIAETDE